MGPFQALSLVLLKKVPFLIKYTWNLTCNYLWRTFESCNNYSMPKDIHTDCRHIEYWVADKEIKDRKSDIAYVKEHFPETIFMKIKDMGHGGLAPFQPEKFVKGIERTVRPVT